jgi:putative Holliday junction resolvase
MNNTLGERAEKTKKFSELVIGLCGIEVVLWDERNTTVSAHKIFNEVNIRGEKRKKSVDTLSATILLQSYLDKAK